MTLINVPSLPVAIKIEEIENALNTLGIIAADVTLKDIAGITMDGEYVTVTYMKYVKGVRESLRIERRIPILHGPPADLVHPGDAAPLLSIVNSVGQIGDKGDDA